MNLLKELINIINKIIINLLLINIAAYALSYGEPKKNI